MFDIYLFINKKGLCVGEKTVIRLVEEDGTTMARSREKGKKKKVSRDDRSPVT